MAPLALGSTDKAAGEIDQLEGYAESNKGLVKIRARMRDY